MYRLDYTSSKGVKHSETVASIYDVTKLTLRGYRAISHKGDPTQPGCVILWVGPEGYIDVTKL